MALNKLQWLICHKTKSNQPGFVCDFKMNWTFCQKTQDVKNYMAFTHCARGQNQEKNIPSVFDIPQGSLANWSPTNPSIVGRAKNTLTVYSAER